MRLTALLGSLHLVPYVWDLWDPPSIAFCADGSWGLSPACHVPVVDTVGAGDGFCAGFLSVLLRGGSLQQCAVAGCMVGREAVSVAGAQIATATWQTLAEQMQGMVAARCQAVCD